LENLIPEEPSFFSIKTPYGIEFLEGQKLKEKTSYIKKRIYFANCIPIY